MRVCGGRIGLHELIHGCCIQGRRPTKREIDCILRREILTFVWPLACIRLLWQLLVYVK